MAWKGEELEAAVVAGVWDMIYCDGRGIYEVVQRVGDDEESMRLGKGRALPHSVPR